MFKLLSDKISSIFSRFSGSSSLKEHDITVILDQIKDAFLEADVSYPLVEEFIGTIKKALLSSKKPCRTTDQVIKIVHDELLSFLGGKQSVPFSFQIPAVVMVMGLQGSGKTTTIAKLAALVHQQAEKRGKKRRILLASIDFCRPAAIDQLEILSERAGCFFYRATSTKPLDAAREIFRFYKQGEYELLFLDTAGRLHIDHEMLEELALVKADLHPRYTFLVLDAMTGQESLAVARGFDHAVGFDAAILTKMDSDTRGGAAFSFRYALKKPVLFTGIGEKLADLEQFHPDRAASRILGMGDLKTLFERASERIQEPEQEDLSKIMFAGKMTLNDFSKQLDMLNKLGSLSMVARYMPAGGGAMSQDDLEKGELEIKRFRAIINGMTPKERLNHTLLNDSRKRRIANGTGVVEEDIKVLIERFEEAQLYVKLLKKVGPFKRFFQ